MKTKLWSGRLPRYWVESPWWDNTADGVLLLVPTATGRVLTCRSIDSGVLWETETTSNVLLAVHDQVAVTARVRDGRSHAVYYQFTAFDTSSGQRVWSVPPELELLLPKTILPQARTAQVPDGPVVELDTWRSLRNGKEAIIPVGEEAALCQPTSVREGPGGLLVNFEGGTWPGNDVRLGQVQGIRGNHLVGVTPGVEIWVRDVRSGHLLWTVNLQRHNVVVPSERIVGLDVVFNGSPQTVPVAGVAVAGGTVVICTMNSEPTLVVWPEEKVLESWPADSQVALLGSVAGAFLIAEEYADGTGCLWLAA